MDHYSTGLYFYAMPKEFSPPALPLAYYGKYAASKHQAKGQSQITSNFS